MSDFNSFNNINIFKNISKTPANLVNNIHRQENGGFKESPTLNQQPMQQMQNQHINPSLMYDFQSAKMDSEVILKYLQNLMNLPNSIDKFIAQLNSKNVDSKMLTILVQNLINTKALGEFLNQNSQEAISKLLQTISTSLKSGINDVSQLKEILSILSSIQASTLNNSNSIKELLLLYIPLNYQVFNKEIEFKKATKEENDAIKNSKLSLLFETINFSNILCCLNEDENQPYIDFFCVKDFPKDKFLTIIKTLSKEINLNPLVDFKNRPETESESKNQNFQVISGGFVPSNILILSHLIIKCILKIDSDFINAT